METKHVTTRATWKADGGEGTLEAVFSTFGVVDRDGDLVEAGAIPNGQKVPMVWSHDWTRMIGKGVTRVDTDRAVFDGNLFMDTEAGRDAFNTMKAMDDLLEYSWGFRVLDADFVERDATLVRVIKRVELFEVSPVLVGAGMNTGTLSLKHGMPFAEQTDAVLAAVADLVMRSRSLADLRLKEGRVLSTANRERLQAIADTLGTAAGDLKGILKDTEPQKAVDGAALYAAYLRAESRLNGVAVA